MIDNSAIQNKRAILIVWNWSEGRDPLAKDPSDEWPASDHQVLIRMDKKAGASGVWEEMENALQDFDQVVVLLHETHDYKESHEQYLMKLWEGKHRVLRVRRFGGAKGPLYVKNHDLGILGSNGNFASNYVRKLQDGGEEEAVSECVIKRTPPQLNPLHFQHIWHYYAFGARQSVELLMHRYREYINAVLDKEIPLFPLLEKSEVLYQELITLANIREGHNSAPLAYNILRYKTDLDKSLSDQTDKETKERTEEKISLIRKLQTEVKALLENRDRTYSEVPCSAAFESLYLNIPPYGL